MGIIESAQNKNFKFALGLKDKKNRVESGLFLVEGKKQVEEIPENWEIKTLFISKGYKYAPENADFFELPQKLFDKLASTQTPQGVIAVVKKKNYNIGEILKQNGFFAVLENIQDPGNLGTIIRSARAFGAKGVFVSKDSADIYSDKTVRASMGSLFNVPVIDDIGVASLIASMKKENIKIFAGSLDGEILSSGAIFKGKSALIIGNEANGLSHQTKELSDFKIKIEMRNGAQSLNAAAAASILMYEASKA